MKVFTNFTNFIKFTPILLLFLTGCATVEPYNYDAFNAEPPRSILVIPPVNNSVDVKAPYTYISTVTRPLAEKGYYVFPVGVIDQFLKENGLPTPAEMNMIPLDKIDENIGADAVLYVTIDNWGQEYQVLSSVTIVKGYAKLISVKSGHLLWEAPVVAQQSSDSGGNGLIGALVNAAVTQIAGSVSDNTPVVARFANQQAFASKQRGLPDGPYMPVEEKK